MLAPLSLGQCASACGFGDSPPATPPTPAVDPAEAAAKAADPAPVAAAGGAEGAVEEGGVFTPSKPFDDGPATEYYTPAAFTQMIKGHPLVVINFYAPWCFWSNRLAPAWAAVSKRLHSRAWSQSVKFIKIDCTDQTAQALCKAQAIHAFPSVRASHRISPYLPRSPQISPHTSHPVPWPSLTFHRRLVQVRIFRGSTHAFEPYEFGREENVMWLHLVKTAAEILVSQMNDAPGSEVRRLPPSLTVTHRLPPSPTVTRRLNATSLFHPLPRPSHTCDERRPRDGSA